MTTGPADGQLLDARPQQPTNPMFVGASQLFNLLNQASGADTSPAVNVVGFSHGSLELTGTATSSISVQLEGSCAEENPDVSGASWSNLGSAVTAMGITSISFAGVRFIRAVQTAPSGGYVNVNLSVVAP